MRTKSDSPHHALYLIYFKNKEMKLRDLRSTKYVLNVAISWSAYIPSKNGPTQCNNCQQHGHGSKNCNLQPRCSQCGSTHTTYSCTSQSTDICKCCLCGQPHSSTDPNCPRRIEYIKMKLHQSTRIPRKSTVQHEPPVRLHSKEWMDSNFPRLRTPNRTKFDNWFPNSSHGSTFHNNESLLTSEELLSLTTELITKLKSCRTKMDQFQVITHLAIKYTNND